MGRSSGRGTPSLRAAARGQVAPLGVALVMAVVVFGTVSVVVFGGMALDDTQSQSELGRAEHVLTLFDSRTAMVALGDADVQTTSLAGGGSYEVQKDAGEIEIVHVDYNETHDETVYRGTMGALVYERDDTEFAYQGGGVWRKDRDGAARMVTPPEFYFRQSTLTFPLIQVTNDDSAAGSVTARATASERAVPIYPNRTDEAAAAVDDQDEVGAPYDPVGSEDYEEPYDNPLENGTVVVWVQSRYYEGWADYFGQRTEAQVDTFDSNETVRAELVSLGVRGRFDMPEEGNGLTVRGLEGTHTLKEFNINITDSDTEADMNNLQWAMYDSTGNEQIELGVRNQGGGDPCGEEVTVSLYYSPDGGTTQHVWQNDSAFTIGCGDIDDDGEEDRYVEVNFTSDDVDMTYGSTNFDKDGLVEYRNDYNKNNVPDSVTWNEHEDSVTYESITFSDGNERAINDTVNHYFALLEDEFTLTVTDKQSGGTDGSVAESSSHGRIDYPGSGKYIAYLHVTENEVEIELD